MISKSCNKKYSKKIWDIIPRYFLTFGEYSEEMKNYIKNFKIGVWSTFRYRYKQDKFELPRFPINEKYGNLERFKSMVNTCL